MGLLRDLFKTTFGGGSGNDGAFNAHLAEIAIKKLDTVEKNTLANEVVAMGIRASGGRVDANQYCDTFNRQSRLCQLNLIALALAKFNIEVLPNVKWMPIDNPFALKITQEEILVNAIYFLKYHNLQVKIEDGTINIRDWLFSKDERKEKFIECSIRSVLDFLKFIESENSITKERFKFVLGIYCMQYITYIVQITKSKQEAFLLFPILIEEFNKLFDNDQVAIGDFIVDETEKQLCCEVIGIVGMDNFENMKGELIFKITDLMKFVYENRVKMFYSGFDDFFSEEKGADPAISYKIVSSLSKQFAGNERDCFLLFSTIYIPIIGIVGEAYRYYDW